MKKKTIAYTVWILVIIFMLIGCNTKGVFIDNDTDSNTVSIDEENTSEVVDEEQDANQESQTENEEDTTNEQEQNTEEENTEEQNDDNEDSVDSEENDNNTNNVKQGIPSPISGIYASDEKVDRRPVAIMFDNHPRARWQAGLGQAEVIYEFQVEYPYTRYMGIFLINDPKHVGPIRSSRPYFVTALLEYDPVYVRVGGSTAAYQYINRLNLADIDGIKSGGFWRYYETGKKTPNNMYSSMAAIRRNQKNKGYRLKGNYEGFMFNEEDTHIEGIDAKNVKIKYNKSNTTEYVFDSDKKVYNRYKDGKLHIDELDKSTITAKNIIIQKAKTKVIDDEGRLSIDNIGSGNGYYITNGKAIEVIWKKESERSKTRYYDSKGKEISFNSGVTWIQVTPLNPNITIN